MKTNTTKQPIENVLVETINSEAVNQNIKPVADFFMMYGDETAETYSPLLMEMMELVFNDEFDNPRRTPEEMQDFLFHIKELNKLVISLKNPKQWVSK
ncbi:MAG: hypothetical protein IM572_06330 [Chitinophagaceae bacterium]|nr:hypothetical protein [Microcystis sp. M065S1]MCA6492275.1 hypothetical protein [Chitinophagaceae bacterium]